MGKQSVIIFKKGFSEILEDLRFECFTILMKELHPPMVEKRRVKECSVRTH